MIVRYFLCALGIGLLSATTGLAGIGSTGGGDAVVCFNSVHKIVSAELLDLYEARELHHLHLEDNHDPVKVRAESIARRLDHNEDFVDDIRDIMKKAQFLSPGTEMNLVDDATIIAHGKKNCQIFQLAVYEPTGDIYINSDIWSHLNWQNRAALYVHEALYYRMRMIGYTTSDSTRRAIGAAFAGIPLVEPFAGVPADFQVCTAQLPGDTHPFAIFYAFANAGHQLELQLTMLDFKPLLWKSTATFQKFTWPFSDPMNQKEGIDQARLDSVELGGINITVSVMHLPNDPQLWIAAGDSILSTHYPVTCLDEIHIHPK